MSTLNQAVTKAELVSDPSKGRKKIFILKKDGNGKLIKADSSILKGKKIVVQQASATHNVELAHKAQMVAKGEYRDKERPFAEKDIWAKYLCPTGHCSVCGQYFHYKSGGHLQNHMQVRLISCLSSNKKYRHSDEFDRSTTIT